MVLTDAFVSLGGTDISAHVKKVSIKPKYTKIDGSRMGHLAQVNEAGIQEWVIALTLKQNFDAASIDSILWTLFAAKASFAVIVRPTSSAVGTGNPNYTGTSIMLEYTPIDTGHNQQVEATVNLDSAGVLSRATS